MCVEKANPRAAMDSSFFTKRESVSSSGKISSCRANSDWGESKSQWLSAKGRNDPVKPGYRTQISMWCMSPAVVREFIPCILDDSLRRFSAHSRTVAV